MKVAFLLLCHGPAEPIVRLISMAYFRYPSIKIYVHYDAKMPVARFEEVKLATEKFGNVTFIEKRVKCRWGEYSLVAATLRMMDAALTDNSFKPDYLYLISSNCLPIKPFSHLARYLEQNSNRDFIEAVDPKIWQWTVGGHEYDRLRYFHPFNYQSQRRLFELSRDLQRRFRISRHIPHELPIRFGSQWFCLSSDTAGKVLSFFGRRTISRFVRRCWIPDEFAIQSAVAAVAAGRIANATLTYYQFNKEGRPIRLYDDHVAHLTRQPHFFARKISPNAKKLISHFASATAIGDGSAVDCPTEMRATPDFAFMQKISARRGSIGMSSQWDIPAGPMQYNQHDYWVVTGSSPAYINAVLAKIRQWNLHRPYGYLFAKNKPFRPVTESDEFGGISSQDVERRNYSPMSFLFDVLQSKNRYVIFALDPLDIDIIVRHVCWDSKSHMISIDPPSRNIVERLIFRLNPDEVRNLVEYSGYQLRDNVYRYFNETEKNFLSYEHSKDKIKSACEADGGIGDCIRAAILDVKLDDVFEDSYFRLIKAVNS